MEGKTEVSSIEASVMDLIRSVRIVGRDGHATAVQELSRTGTYRS
jgi:hypothetical protein